MKNKKRTNNDFIEESKKIWGDGFFDYRDCVYINRNEKVILYHNGIKCLQSPIHNLEHHLPIELSDKKKKTVKELIDEFNKVHGNKYIYGNFTYINAKLKNIPFYCPVIGKNGKPHGWNLTNATNHLAGCGCRLCKSDKLSDLYSSNKDNFIEKARKIHGDYYSYDKVEYIKNNIEITITCPKHGDFKQTPANHLQGKGCPFCNQSHLENEVKTFLEENNIKYVYQYRIKWLNKQSIDFYLPDYNIGIECQGEQHYKENHFFEDLSKIQNRDKTKFELCKKNNMELIYYSKENYNSPGPIIFTDLQYLLSFLKK